MEDLFTYKIIEGEVRGRKYSYKEWKVNQGGCLCHMRESCPSCQTHWFIKTCNSHAKELAIKEAIKEALKDFQSAYDIGKKVSDAYHQEKRMSRTSNGIDELKRHFVGDQIEIADTIEYSAPRQFKGE